MYGPPLPLGYHGNPHQLMGPHGNPHALMGHMGSSYAGAAALGRASGTMTGRGGSQTYGRGQASGTTTGRGGSGTYGTGQASGTTTGRGGSLTYGRGQTQTGNGQKPDPIKTNANMLASIHALFGNMAFLPTATLSPEVINQPYVGGVHPTVPYPLKQRYTGGRVRGLFIGCNYLGSVHELNGCINDVAMILGALEKVEFPLEEACILVDDPKFKGQSGPPTRDNIINHFKWLVHDAKPGDVFIFHFSGHGSQQQNLKGDEEDGLDDTLVPLDFEQQGCIVDDDIFDMVVRPLPQGVRLTAIMDCCHSGSAMDLPFEFKADKSMGAGVAYRMMATTHWKPNARHADVVMFSGCSNNQTSADVQDTDHFGNTNVNKHGKGTAGGACTNAITHALTQTTGLTYAQLLLYMRDKLRSEKFKQVPQLSSTKPVDMDKIFSLFGKLESTQDFSQAPRSVRDPSFAKCPAPKHVTNPVQIYRAGGAAPLILNRNAVAPKYQPL